MDKKPHFNLGKKRTQEFKNKKSKFMKEFWRNPNNKNLLLNRNKKISNKLKGIKKSQEHNKKNKESHIGNTWVKIYGEVKAKKLKEQYRKRFKKNNPMIIRGGWNSQERIKMSKRRRKGLKEGRIIVWNKGKKNIYSKETLNKIKTARAKQVFPLEDTSIEIKIQNFLKELGIEFATHQYIKDIKYGYQCDIFIPVQEGINKKTIIECDGDYWHGNLEIHPINKLSKKIKCSRCLDYERTAQLEESGFRVIRLWENQIRQLELNNFIQILA